MGTQQEALEDFRQNLLNFFCRVTWAPRLASSQLPRFSFSSGPIDHITNPHSEGGGQRERERETGFPNIQGEEYLAF